jgi:hypothetical protein
VIFSSYTTDPNAMLTLSGANGPIKQWKLAGAVGYPAGNPVTSLAAGSYTLAVTGVSPGAAPAYSFGFYDMSSAATLTAGTPVSVQFQPNQAVAAYKISLTAGSPLRLFTTRDYPRYGDQLKVLDPNGVPLAAPASYYDGAATFAINATSDYTVLFEGQNYGCYGQVPTVNYTLTTYVDAPPTTIGLSAALHFGDTVSGALADPSSIQRYKFTLGAESNIPLNSLTPDGNASWTLTGPNGCSLTRNFYL